MGGFFVVLLEQQKTFRHIFMFLALRSVAAP